MTKPAELAAPPNALITPTPSTSNWNKKHNITIFGYEIELYIQDSNEIHHSTGIYSVLNDSWITKPNRIEPEIDENMVKRKI